MAARFLASAFAAGPALLIMLALIVKKTTKFDPGEEPIHALARTVMYAMIANVFFLGLELFTAFYSGIPGHAHAFEYLYRGLEGHGNLVGLMWLSTITALISLVLLIPSGTRNHTPTLVTACIALFISLWIDKGFGLVVGGFVPNPFGTVTDYWPTLPETIITIAIWAAGFFVLTVLYKVAIGVREAQAPGESTH